MYSKLFLNDQWRAVPKFAEKKTLNEDWLTNRSEKKKTRLQSSLELNKTTDYKMLKKDVL